MRTQRRAHRRDRGALLGIVLVLLTLVLAASAFAFWGLRGDTNATGNDRLERQLFDCAEQALALGKVQFGNLNRANWDVYLSTNVCATTPALPCPSPFPSGAPTTPTSSTYPNISPWTGTITVTTNGVGHAFTYQLGLYNNSEDVTTKGPLCSQASGADTSCTYHDGDNRAVVYARCTDQTTLEWRATQALITATVQASGCPYRAMAGAGCHGNGNQN
jgi:Tfp pilus assembly protein PilX